MPVLDAKALKTDRKGLAFLRSVLRNEQGSEEKGRKPAEAPSSKAPPPATTTSSG